MVSRNSDINPPPHWRFSLHWYHNECDDVSNHQPQECLLNCSFRRRSHRRKHRSSASLVFVRGIPRWPMNSPSKRPVTRSMFPFDDVIMFREMHRQPVHSSYKRPIIRKCVLTHRGRVTHIYAGKLTIIGSDNGLSPVRRQAIIWTNAWILLIRPSGTNFSEILIEIDVFALKKMHLKMSSAKWRPVVSASMS